MNISFCTLFEGNYHFGVAALSNSLIAAGYAGTLWVGYRGALSFASKWYSRFANAPIRVYLDGALARRQLSLKIAAAIGHVFKRA